MTEFEYTHEVTVLIAHFRHMVLYGKDDNETLREAWKTYFSIKAKNFRPEPTDPKELEKIRKTVEFLVKGEISESNYADAVYYGLRVDLGFYNSPKAPGLIGILSEEEKKKADSFSQKMHIFLIENKQS